MKNTAFRLFTAGLFLFISVHAYSASDSVGLFTPAIDGIKETAWGSSPTESSTGYSSVSGNAVGTYHSENACQDIYITDDPDYLYIGYYYNGDVWESMNDSARIMFGVITNTLGTSGGSTDPWEATTSFGSANRPDFFLRQWTEAPYDERMEFGPQLGYSSATKGVSEFLKWDGSYWVGAGSVIHYERLTTNNIPAGTMTVYVTNVTGWDTPVRIHYWGGSYGSSDGSSWPSNLPEMTDEGNGVWSYTFDYKGTTDLLFIDNDGSVESGNLSRTGSGTYVVGTGWSTSDAAYSTFANNWAEIAIPLSTLGVETGDEIKLLHYYRPDMSQPGFSDSTPYDPNASVNGATGATLNSNFTYIIRSDNIAPALSEFSPSHAQTGLSRDENIVFRVTDNVAFGATNVTVTIEGNTALTNGVFQSGYNGTIQNSGGNNYLITVNPDNDFDYDQQVNVNIQAKDEADNSTEKAYYFNIEPDTTAPSITSLNPGANDTGVARNAMIQCTVSDDDQVAQNEITIKVNGSVALSNSGFKTGFAGTSSQIVQSGNGYQITIDPESVFDFSDTVTVNIQAKDVSGNGITSNYSFTITSDDIAPVVENITPEPGAANQLRSAGIAFQLNDNIGVVSNMIQAQVNAVDAILNGAFQDGYSGSITANGNGFSVTVNPDDDFDFSETVNVWAEAKDSQNNTVTSNWSFTVKPDDIAPTISGQTPSGGASGQENDVNIVFNIDDDTLLDINTLDIRVNGEDAVVNGIPSSLFTVNYVDFNNGKTVTLNPDDNFIYDQTVLIYVYAEDSTGNPLSSSYSFTVKSDDVIPVIQNLAPLKDEEDVSINENVSFRISDESSVENASVIVKINDELALTNGEFQSPYNGALSAMATVGGNSIDILIDHTAEWNYRSTNTVDIMATDPEGNLLETNYIFIAEHDLISPAFVDFTPGNGSTVPNNTSVSFEISDNEMVMENSIDVFLVVNGSVTNTAIDNGIAQAGYSVTITPNEDNGFSVLIDPDANLTFGDTIKVILHCGDYEKNTADFDLWTFSVQSADTTEPVISRMSPAVGEVDVEPDAVIYFELADNEQALSESIVVTVELTEGVPTIALSNSIFIAPFDGPQSAVISNAVNGFDVTVDYTGLYDFTNDYNVYAYAMDNSAGSNEIEMDWGFTIRPPDTTAPVIGQVQPSDGMSDIPIASSISFMVTDNYGVLSNDIQVLINGTTALSNGEYLNGFAGGGSSLSANAQNGQTVMIDPESDFTYGETITLIITAMDTSSNVTISTNTFEPQGLEQATAYTSLIDPNRGSDTIQVKVNRTGYATVTISNLRGETIAVIDEQYYNIGDFIEWNGKLESTGETVGSGWYFVRIVGSDINTTVKVMVLR